MFEPFPVLCQLLHFMDTVYLCKSSGEDTGPEKGALQRLTTDSLDYCSSITCCHRVCFLLLTSHFSLLLEWSHVCVCFHSCFEFYLSKVLYNVLTLFFSFLFLGGSLFFSFYFFVVVVCLFLLIEV